MSNDAREPAAAPLGDPVEATPGVDPVVRLELLGSDQDPGVLGIDNVRLDLPVAGIGSRLLAILIDQVAIFIAAMLWIVACMAVGALLLSKDSGGMVVIAVLVGVGIFLIDFTYYAVCEIRMGGRTPGKSVLGLRTVNSLGGEASPAAIVVRNALRVFDYLVGTLMVMIDSKSRRLGDLVAGTLVIHDPDRKDPNEARVGSWPAHFSSREIALTEQLLRRIPRLLPERARELAAQFLAALRGRDPDFIAAAPGEPHPDPVFELWRVFRVETGTPGEG